MIKFKINGMEVEVDNIADAKALMTFEPLKKEPLTRKASRKEKYSHWTVEEVSKLTKAIETNDRKVLKDAALRDKHTRGAISGMMWTLAKPERVSKYGLKSELNEYVQRWYSQRKVNA